MESEISRKLLENKAAEESRVCLDKVDRLKNEVNELND
jgi:hypothetical protein